MAIHFEITKGGSKEEFFFKLLSEDGKTLLRSEGYNAKSSCTNGIESVQKNGIEEKRYELKNASDGRPYFNLKATNGQVIGTSPMFADEEKRTAAITQIQQNVASASTTDNS